MNAFGAVGFLIAGMLIGEYYSHKVDRIRREQIRREQIENARIRGRRYVNGRDYR